MSTQIGPQDGVAALADVAATAPAPATRVSVAAAAKTLLLMDMKFLSWNPQPCPAHGCQCPAGSGTADPADLRLLGRESLGWPAAGRSSAVHPQRTRYRRRRPSSRVRLWRRADATMSLRFCAKDSSGSEDAQVSAEELAGVDGALREAAGALETSQVADVQLRPRLVGRVTAGRVGEDERLREVAVRAVDQRNVTVANGVRGVDDPHGLGGAATRRQRDLLTGDGGAGDTRAEPAVHAVRRGRELERRVVREARGARTVVQVDGCGNEAGRVEVSHGALVREGVVLRRVAVGHAEQDLRLAELLALTQRVKHEVRVRVRAEVVVEDVDADRATGRGGRAGGRGGYRAGASDQGQRRRGGEDLALDGHEVPFVEPTAVPCARLSMPRRIENGRPGGFTSSGEGKPRPASGRKIKRGTSAANRVQAAPALLPRSPLAEGRRHYVTQGLRSRF